MDSSTTVLGAVKALVHRRVKVPPENWFVPLGSNRSDGGGNKAVGASGVGKGPQLKGNVATKTEGLAMSLSTPESVQKLQTALHDKSEESPGFRFYALYDKVYRRDVLAFGYECCKANSPDAPRARVRQRNENAWCRVFLRASLPGASPLHSNTKPVP